MKRLVVTLVIALVAACLGYGLVAWRRAAATQALESRSGTDLEWLRTEFRLDAAQFAAVEALHLDYWPACAGHCAAIQTAQEKVDELKTAGAPATGLSAAEQAVRDLEGVCNEATRAHLHRVAAVMAPAEARRFLQLIEPRLASLPHDPAVRSGFGH